MDHVRKKACPVSLCMPDLEHLEGIAMFLRPARQPAPARATQPAASPAGTPVVHVAPPGRPAPRGRAGAGRAGADGGEKFFAGQAGAHCIFARVVIK